MGNISEEDLNKLIKAWKQKEHLNSDLESKDEEEYIDWLERFTKIYKKFDTKSINFIHNIALEDKININLLTDLCINIETYEKENGIEEKFINGNRSFYIKHNDIGYIILRAVYDNEKFWCIRVESQLEDYYIEYDDIKKLKENVFVKEKRRID